MKRSRNWAIVGAAIGVILGLMIGWAGVAAGGSAYPVPTFLVLGLLGGLGGYLYGRISDLKRAK